MIVLHEELMEDIYDWLSDAEKQADSIAVNEDDISSVMEEYGRHRVWILILEKTVSPQYWKHLLLKMFLQRDSLFFSENSLRCAPLFGHFR